MSRRVWVFVRFGLSKMYSYIVIISSTNEYRKYAYLSVTCTQNDNKYTFTMARWQTVVKKSEATNQTKENKQTNKSREEGGGGAVRKQITN